ncbi:phosphotransferase [Clostridium sp. D2Q-11]|uniref:Phosphotransferase n=2 Tax=Anaeromonas frigoriresistens TaxID=2683708 RepID=A0A942UWD1_9FIRM|nr:phosphotransferase [Anaeromonas frigoriresistens]MBS4538039.1 phosphotransferase [Anaeromonas frigoriresistens]
MSLAQVLEARIKTYVLNNDVNIILNKNRLIVSFLAQGEYNINFTIEDGTNKYVFRVNTGSQINVDNQIEYEFNALKTLEVSKVTPKVYYVDSSKSQLEYGILIMEYLEGEPLIYQKDLMKASKVFAKIHSLDLKNMDTSKFIVESNICGDRILEGKNLLKDYLTSPIINKKNKKFFKEFLYWAEDNKDRDKYFNENKCHVINNTEVNSSNFIIGKKESFLIDWEKPVISDPSQDLTQFLAETTTLWKGNYILSKDEKKAFYKEYKDNLTISIPDIEERVHLYTPYLYLRALSWCAYAYLEYQKPGKDIKNMDTYVRIKQYLDIDFMERLLKEYW